MSVKLLSDFQLYALSFDQFLPDAQKAIVQDEMSIRDIEQETLESFHSDLKRWEIGEPGKAFSVVEYIFILLTSPLIVLHLIFQTILYRKRKYKSWEHYWKIVLYGNTVWLAVGLFVAFYIRYLSINSVEIISP